MARPERNNVDYFPFICEDGNKMFYIEETYGNDGFATFVKILRELAKTDFHYLDLSRPTTMMFLSAKCKVSKDILVSIISDLVDLGKFDPILWNENKIIWCDSFTESIKDAYLKRNNKCITYEGLLIRLQSLGVRKPSLQQSTAPVNPQSKVEYSKVDENKLINAENGFDSFWLLYPKKVEKEACRKIYARLSITDKQKISETLSAFLSYKPFPDYNHPNPKTYLNKKRWNDEIDLSITKISLNDERFKQAASAIRSADQTI